ncbi:GNAT family N-acetyltransferase [Nannocystis radixulma]|uniref:GNAT family protein n=1 Tax=Nannocystis radixulma TaxID=2995305 RepID=A0ABT5BG27_9BACT|nr:GNAT family protein [Nannocystis radixulma]MDC0673095.1 GNAT family protein [Nannocystis radixulma]
MVEPLEERHEAALARLVALEGDAPLRGAPRPASPEATRAWLADVVRERRARKAFAFVGRSDDGELAGVVYLGGASRRTALLSYWLAPNFRGRGLARAMVQPVVDHAFAQLGLARLDAFVVEENAPSRALLASLGFRLAGRVLGTTAPGATGEDAPVLAYVCPRPTQRRSAP